MIKLGQMITIRRATLEESSAVAALARDSFMAAVAPHYNEEGVRTFMEFATADGMLKRMTENYMTYVAHRDEELVGMAHVRDGSHLAMLFVVPHAQRSGVGRALVEASVTGSASDVVTVNASPNSEQAYLRFGFRRTSAEQVIHGIRFIPMALKRQVPSDKE